MTQHAAWFLAVVASVFGAAASLTAQRGGRGRSEAIKSRVGSYFVTATLPTVEGEKSDPLAAVAMVREAAAAHQLAVLYLYDPKDERKHEQFEKTVFNNDEVGVALRCFRCGRIDVSADAQARARYGKQAPLFVVFGSDGKPVGEVPMTGYKAVVNPLVAMLARAATEVKPSLAEFVSRCRGVVNQLEQLEGKRKLLQERRARLDAKGKGQEQDAGKRAELDQDGKALDAEEQKTLADEKELLEQAKVPPRDPSAQRLADQGGR